MHALGLTGIMVDVLRGGVMSEYFIIVPAEQDQPISIMLSKAKINDGLVPENRARESRVLGNLQQGSKNVDGLTGHKHNAGIT